MTTQTRERTYTPWWAFAVAVLAGLLAIAAFVSAASEAPIVRGRAHTGAVGQDTSAQDGKLEFSLLDARTDVDEIGDSYFGTTPSTGSYTVVTLTVRNISNETVTFDGTYVVGIDEHGSPVSSDREAQYYANEDGAGMLSTLHPGQQIRASVAFDVAPDAPLAAVQVHDSVFSRGAQIDLDAA